jgi:cell division protease FtsH
MAGNEPRPPKGALLTKRPPPSDSSGGVAPNATAPA